MIGIQYGSIWNKHVTRNNLFDSSIAFSFASALAVGSTSILNLYIITRFGANYQADAFFVAYTVPGLMASAMLSAMQVVLVPTFVRLREEQKPVDERRWVAWLGILGLLICSGLALLGVAGGPFYVKAFTPGIASATKQIAVQISRWIFVVVPLTWLSGFLQSLLNSQQRFILPLISESFANILAVIILLTGGKDTTVIMVSFVFVAKMIVHVLFLGLGAHLYIKIDKNIMGIANDRTGIGATFQGLGMRFGAALARQSNITVERFWTANLTAGTVSALSYAQMGVNTLSRIFSTSVSTVLLPSLSEMTRKEANGRGGVSVDILRLSLFLTVPVAAFSMIISYPVSRIIMSFSNTHSDLVLLTARLLAIDVWRIPLMALVAVLLAPFYAVEDIKTPVNHMLLMLGVNLILDVMLFYIIGIYAFPLAAVLTDAVSVLRLFWLQRRLRGPSIPVFTTDLRYSIVGLTVSIGIAVTITWLLFRILIQYIGTSMGGQIVSLGIALLIGGSIYLLAIWLTKLPEAVYIVATIKIIRAKVIKRW
jgi:putative peptidoglycan lipid II flippase